VGIYQGYVVFPFEEVDRQGGIAARVVKNRKKVDV